PVFTEVVGVGCVLDGVRYGNGESFQPSCKFNCTCVDGAVGCTPLCLRVRPPRLWCRHPRRVRLPGRCCEQWVCDDGARRLRKTAPRHTGDLAVMGEAEPWHGNCIAHTSPWSPCSTSCGLGISTRVSNANARCWPEQESRLCALRPCDVDIRPLIKEGKKCLAVYQPEAPVNLTLAGCVSTRAYRPKYCGVCTDSRCCIPYKSKTIDVSFQCPDGPASPAGSCGSTPASATSAAETPTTSLLTWTSTPTSQKSPIRLLLRPRLWVPSLAASCVPSTESAFSIWSGPV
ncbi:WNT1-inducible-signaling pathway protein 1, partial [Myotis lucifugus]|uniref:WNT1-inducible-signaling pathway protein 1 n=1 Tax=Myotis lucifugus TaxID=59463 RepID=UPI000CCC9857